LKKLIIHRCILLSLLRAVLNCSLLLDFWWSKFNMKVETDGLRLWKLCSRCVISWLTMNISQIVILHQLILISCQTMQCSVWKRPILSGYNSLRWSRLGSNWESWEVPKILSCVRMNLDRLHDIGNCHIRGEKK
jgi:hypothetical protein